eukprot:1201950-Amphidinium_carterae.1
MPGLTGKICEDANKNIGNLSLTASGEARKPGPTTYSVNPGGWSRVTGTLTLHFDIVAVKKTFLLREVGAVLGGAHFTAKQQGYYSAFTPARRTG